MVWSEVLRGKRNSGKEIVVCDWRAVTVRNMSFRQVHFPGGREELREEVGVGNEGREDAGKGVWFPLLFPWDWIVFVVG